MGVVGTFLAVLLVFLLWRFCIRRKAKNGGNIDPITPQYHPVSTIPENGTRPLTYNSVSMTSDGTTSHYGLGMQKYGSIIIPLPSGSNSFFISNNLQVQPPIAVSYDRSTSSYSGLPPTLYTNQSTSSLSRTQQIHHNPQERISTPSMMTDRPPMYSFNPLLDESAAASSSSSSNGNTNEKRSPVNILSYTAVAEPEDRVTSTVVPGRHEENAGVWDGGYPQPPRFMPIA